MKHAWAFGFWGVIGFVMACERPPATPSGDPPSDTTPPPQTPLQKRAAVGAPDESAAPAKEGPPEKPLPPSARCDKNRDCVLSTFTTCCACCPGVPHAFTKAQLEALEGACTKVCHACEQDCGPPVDITSYSARCIDTKCVALPQ